MGEWKVHYRDKFDEDRTSRQVASREAALKQARTLQREHRAVIYRIEGPNGELLHQDDVARWASANRW